MKCKCDLCVSLVIICYRGMKDHGSAGNTHLNSLVREGERVGLGAVAVQRLKEKKGASPPRPPTNLSSISLLEMTPEAHPYRGQYTGGGGGGVCTHVHAQLHKPVILSHPIFA